MKILVRLFLIILVMFSCSHANDSLLDKFTDAEISSFNARSDRYKHYEKVIKERAIKDKKIKLYYQRYGKYWLKESETYKKKALSYKEMKKDDRNKLYKTIIAGIKDKKTSLERSLKWVSGAIIHYKNDSRTLKQLTDYKNKTDKQVEAHNKNLKQLKEEHEKENLKFNSKFDAWNKTSTTKKKKRKVVYELPMPPRVVNNQLQLPRTDQNRKPPKIAIETPRKKPKQFFVKPIVAPLIPKRPTNAIIPPPKITPKPMIVNQGNGKTVLKNVNILTTAKTGNINTKGKLNVANIKVAKGTTLKDTNINADVNVKNISVSKGSTADIGSVNITK